MNNADIPEDYGEFRPLAVGFILDISCYRGTKNLDVVTSQIIDWLGNRQYGDESFLWPNEWAECSSCVYQFANYKQSFLEMPQVVAETIESMNELDDGFRKHVVYLTDRYDPKNKNVLKRLTNKEFKFWTVGLKSSDLTLADLGNYTYSKDSQIGDFLKGLDG